MISERQKLFCLEYVKDFRAEAAMVRAGYAKSTARKKGALLLRDYNVALYLKSLMDKIFPSSELTGARVLEEMRRLAFADIKEYYKWSPEKNRYVLKSLEELTPDQTAAIQRYVPGEGYYLYDKQNALEKLGKHFKLFTDLNETIHSFTMMPTIKRGGKEHVFDVGKPPK